VSFYKDNLKTTYKRRIIRVHTHKSHCSSHSGCVVCSQTDVW